MEPRIAEMEAQMNALREDIVRLAGVVDELRASLAGLREHAARVDASLPNLATRGDVLEAGQAFNRLPSQEDLRRIEEAVDALPHSDAMEKLLAPLGSRASAEEVAALSDGLSNVATAADVRGATAVVPRLATRTDVYGAVLTTGAMVIGAIALLMSFE